MKKIVSLVLLVLLIASIFPLAGCVNSDASIAKRNLEKLLNAMQNKDSEGVRSLFAKNKIADIENFDESIENLLAYYEGEYTPFLEVGPATGTSKEGKHIIKYQEIPNDITTTVGVYRIALLWYIEDTVESDNIGIWSLYIIKKEDDTEEERSYVGDGKWSYGINIATPRPASTDILHKTEL